MNAPIRSFLLLMLLSLAGLAPAQVIIDYNLPTEPDELEVCDSSVFEIILTNGSNITVTGVNITVQFPAGIVYNPGSLSNATEVDLSNLSAPVFSIPDLVASEVHSFAFFATAGCEMVEAINTGEVFTNTINVNYNGGTSSAMTDPYDVETPLLVTTNFTNSTLTGVRGDIFTRTVTLTNSRLGALSAFTFVDNYSPGIVLSSPDGTILPSGPNQLQVLLSGADFSAIGDGDDLFEIDESIVITEIVEIIDCGADNPTAPSVIFATWGCNNETCQSTLPINMLVNIQLSNVSPDLVLTPSVTAPDCFCGETPYQQSMTITNNGTESASNITLTLRALGSDVSFAPGSFSLDSNTVISPYTPLLNGVVVPDYACPTSDGLVYETALVSYPSLGVGETITFTWDMISCRDFCGRQSYISWVYDYGYYKSCPPDPFIFSEDNIASGVGDTINVDLTPAQGNIEDNETRTFNYEVSAGLLTEPVGSYLLEVEFPCSFIWLGSTLEMGGQIPSINETITDSSTIITAIYDLPFPAETVNTNFDLTFICDLSCQEELCLDSLVTSCEMTCVDVIPPITGFIVRSSITTDDACPLGCGISACNEVQMSYTCDNIEYCLDTIPGYMNYTQEFMRINYGLADNNDDRIPDVGGIMDTSLIRTDRAIAGDTLCSVIRGVVIADVPGATFDYAWIDIGLSSLGLDFDVNGELLTEQGISGVSINVKIYDSSSNTFYEGDEGIPIIIEQTPNPYRYTYDLSPSALVNSNCNLPSDFSYADGDSIILTTKYRINYNIRKQNPLQAYTAIVDLLAIPDIYLFNTPGTPREDLFSCGCEREQIELSGYLYDFFSGIFALNPCDTSEYTGSSLFKIELGEGNFFPFEFRNLALLSEWRMSMPTIVAPVESKITSLQLQEQIILANEDPIIPTFSGGEYIYDLLGYQTPLLDEGFSFLFQYRFENECNIIGNYPLVLAPSLTFHPSLPEPNNPLDSTVVSASSLRAMIPNLDLDADFFNITSFDNKARLDFSIRNFSTTVAASESGAAENCWLYAESLSGNVSDYTLLNIETGTELTQVNGIFQLGDIGLEDTLNYRLVGLNSSCVSETVIVHYGWSCTPYENQIETPCYEKTTTFTVLSPPAELEMEVESPTGPFALCDTVAYHTVELFNAQLGSAYNIILQANLPQGFQVLAGSSEIAIPTGGGFIPLGDPTLTGSVAEWDISALNDSIGQNGLPGINSTPNNSISIRFRGLTSCSFISGAYIIFTGSAEQNCDLATNSLSEASDRIDISGIVQPYEASIASSSLLDPDCGNEVNFAVEIFADDITTSSDSVFITLPPGISYEPGSYISGAIAPAGEPQVDIINGQQVLRWQLPAALPSGELIEFEIDLIGFEQLDCGNEILRVQTVSPASAFCVESGVGCDLLVETGSAFFNIAIERPIFELSNFNITVNPPGVNTGISYSLDVTNNGGQAEPPTILDFYLDIDGNGILSPGDEFLFADSLTFFIGGSSTILATGYFPFEPDFCQLMVVIDPNKHCACSSDQTTLTEPITFYRVDDPIVCSGDTVTIGIDPQVGSIYQWQPNNYIDCDNCPMTEFSLENLGEDINVVNYTLVEEAMDGCVIENIIRVNVYPLPTILNETAQVCLGDSIELVTTEATNYFWSGPGVFDANAPTQTVSPAMTSTYTVTISNAAGCSEIDSVLVEVFPSFVADAGVDTAYCDGGLVQLNAAFNENYTYQWSSPLLLSNPNIHNPIIVQNIANTYTVTVTNEDGCESTDEVMVSFGDAPILTISDDLDICDGQEVTLSVSGANTYEWSPAASLDCSTCPVVNANPSETTTYQVIGMSIDGCTATTDVTVTVSETLSSSETMSTCAGEPVNIFGALTDVPGIYCDTIVTAACDSIHCITLLVNGGVDTEEDRLLCPGDTLFFNNNIFTETGTYCGTFTSTDGCDSTHCINLGFAEAPIISLQDTTLFLGQEVTLDLPTEFTYNWSPPEGISCTDCANPTFSPVETTTYSGTVTNSAGCVSVSVITISVITDCQASNLMIPTAITPDGDGVNDSFGIANPFGVERVISMEIYNRWGEKVFTGAGRDVRWYAKQKSKSVTSEVFVYIIEIECPGGATEIIHGDLTVIR